MLSSLALSAEFPATYGTIASTQRNPRVVRFPFQ